MWGAGGEVSLAGAGLASLQGFSWGGIWEPPSALPPWALGLWPVCRGGGHGLNAIRSRAAGKPRALGSDSTCAV